MASKDGALPLGEFSVQPILAWPPILSEGGGSIEGVFEDDDDVWSRREPPAWMDIPGPVSAFDAVSAPADAVAAVAVAAPGASPVAVLAAIAPERLDLDGCVDALVALERQVAWLQGVQQAVLARVERLTPDCSSRRAQTRRNAAREHVGCALRLAPMTAAERLSVATALTRRLPATLAALQAGRITYWHARALVDGVADLDADLTRLVEETVLARADRDSVGEFRATVRRAVLTVDMPGARERQERALGDRRVTVRPAEDGMATLWALLPADGAATITAAIDALAMNTGTGDTDGRTVEQRRADALVELGARAVNDAELSKAHGQRPSIQVTVALSTLLGLDEQPGELAGHGPIHAELARRLADDETGTWRRLVTDPTTGDLLDYGRTTYRPPTNLRDYVLARDQRCVFPHCSRPACRGDIDHLVRWADGGTTSPENLAAVCERHHYLKDEHGWRLRRNPDHSYTWTAPTGHEYVRHSVWRDTELLRVMGDGSTSVVW